MNSDFICDVDFCHADASGALTVHHMQPNVTFRQTASAGFFMSTANDITWTVTQSTTINYCRLLWHGDVLFEASIPSVACRAGDTFLMAAGHLSISLDATTKTFISHLVEQIHGNDAPSAKEMRRARKALAKMERELSRRS